MDIKALLAAKISLALLLLVLAIHAKADTEYFSLCPFTGKWLYEHDLKFPPAIYHVECDVDLCNKRCREEAGGTWGMTNYSIDVQRWGSGPNRTAFTRTENYSVACDCKFTQAQLANMTKDDFKLRVELAWK